MGGGKGCKQPSEPFQKSRWNKESREVVHNLSRPAHFIFGELFHFPLRHTLIWLPYVHGRPEDSI